MTKNELYDNLINRDGYKRDICWCPLCNEHGKKAVFLVPWLSPQAKLVCVYGACQVCGDILINSPQRLQSSMSDQIEQTLLARYPQLFAKLPKGYSPCPR